MSQRMAGQTRAVPRHVALAAEAGSQMHVDTYRAAPAEMKKFATMNPFHFDTSWRIPVPGQPGHFSSSVEGLWQGLKLIDGQPDLDLFDEPPYKRPPDEERGPGFSYPSSQLLLGGRPVDLITGRLCIYLPAYLYLLDRLVPDAVVEEILHAIRTGRDVIFFDWDDNFDIAEPSRSFSHSALLAAWFGQRLEEEFLSVRHDWLRTHPELPPCDHPLPLRRYRQIHAKEH